MVNKNIPKFSGKHHANLPAEVTQFLTSVDHVFRALRSKKEKEFFLSFIKMRFSDDALTQMEDITIFSTLSLLKTYLHSNHFSIISL